MSAELLAAADRLERSLRAELRRALREADSAQQRLPLTRAVSRADAARLETLLMGAWTVVETQWQQALRETTAAGVASGGRQAMLNLRIRAGFNVLNPDALAAADQRVGHLIREITGEQRRAVQQGVRRVVAGEWAPSELEAHLRQVVGLTSRMETQLAALRTDLAARGLRAARIEMQARVWRRRTLANRTETIARTEAIWATAEGQQVAWRQTQRDGTFPAGAVRVWSVTGDSRLCPICAPMQGEETTLDRPFSGGVDHPPRHPRCRCTVVLRRPRRVAGVPL